MELVASQTLAAKVLARTGSPRLAAKKSGLSLDEVRVLQKDPAFNDQVLEYGTTPAFRTLMGLQHLGTLALKVLREELSVEKIKKVRKGRPRKDEKYSPFRSVEVNPDPRRIRAAKVVLDHMQMAIEHTHLLARIKSLEEQLQRERGVPLPAPVEVEVIAQSI